MDDNTDRRLILLHEADNVVVCVQSVAAGELLILDGEPLKLVTAIEIGHKLARWDIKIGKKVFKYGVPIGSAKVAIQRGEHVHIHNIKSDYIPSHTRSGINNDVVKTDEVSP